MTEYNRFKGIVGAPTKKRLGKNVPRAQRSPQAGGNPYTQPPPAHSKTKRRAARKAARKVRRQQR